MLSENRRDAALSIRLATEWWLFKFPIFFLKIGLSSLDDDALVKLVCPLIADKSSLIGAQVQRARPSMQLLSNRIYDIIEKKLSRSFLFSIFLEFLSSRFWTLSQFYSNSSIFRNSLEPLTDVLFVATTLHLISGVRFFFIFQRIRVFSWNFRPKKINSCWICALEFSKHRTRTRRCALQRFWRFLQ